VLNAVLLCRTERLRKLKNSRETASGNGKRGDLQVKSCQSNQKLCDAQKAMNEKNESKGMQFWRSLAVCLPLF
jgi:hypothetical protein